MAIGNGNMKSEFCSVVQPFAPGYSSIRLFLDLFQSFPSIAAAQDCKSMGGSMREIAIQVNSMYTANRLSPLLILGGTGCVFMICTIRMIMIRVIRMVRIILIICMIIIRIMPRTLEINFL